MKTSLRGCSKCAPVCVWGGGSLYTGSVAYSTEKSRESRRQDGIAGWAPGPSVCIQDCKRSSLILIPVRLYRVFKDLQRTFQNLPWLPFGNSDRQEVLISSLMCRECFSGG